MVIMAGMLPGVECARRRRVWQSSSGAAEARRASLCLYAGGRGRDLGLGSSSSAAASSKVWSGACAETTAAMARAWTTTLGSDAREAKERLDHKLRAQRQPVVLTNRHQMSTGAAPSPPARPHDDAACTSTGGGDGGGIHRNHSATMTTACGELLQREVLPSTPSRPKKGGGRGRFAWCGRLAGGRRGPPAEEEAECAVCLEELRAGDVVARLPCAHRFHWSCAVPWVQAVSRCPVCRAHARVCLAAAGSGSPTTPSSSSSSSSIVGRGATGRILDRSCNAGRRASVVSSEGRHARTGGAVRWLFPVAL